MPTTAPRRGFTLVEVLASISAFTIVFLAGFGGIGKLLLTQDQNYARTMAGSAAMLLADIHATRAINAGTHPSLISDLTANSVLVDVTGNVDGNTKFHGYDFTSGVAGTDKFYVMFADKTAASETITVMIPGGGNTTLDLSNRTLNQFETSEYRMLLISISDASPTEPDSHLSFRQVSFWYGPPEIIQSYRDAPQTITLELVGRYLLPDVYTP